MLDDLFGETGGAIAQFVLALIVVLVLILLVAWLLKKLGGGRFGATHAGQAELEIIDTLAIDPKRRLVLVRHGKLEHLLLIGGGSDEVVERSIVGGLPITARMQASKAPAPTPVPEKPAEPLARPSSQFLERLERTNAARKTGTSKTDGAKLEDAGGEDKIPSNDLAALGAAASASQQSSSAASISGSTSAAPSTAASGSAYATMIAATSKAESKSAPPTEQPSDKAPRSGTSAAKAEPATAASIPSTPITATSEPAPAPIDLPPLLDLPKTTGTQVNPTDRPLPKSEREALEQSLDAALHDSLLAPEPTKSPEPTSTPDRIELAPETSPSADAEPADDMDFNLFDDGELEREMEAALADTSPAPAPSPELDAQSTAAIESELAIELETPSKPQPIAEPQPATVPEPAATPETVSDPKPTSSPKTDASSVATDVEETSQDKAKDTDEKAADLEGSTDGDTKEDSKDTLPPLKDIPVELSRPDPVAIQIPSRGPAANATSVTKADNGISGEAADVITEDVAPKGTVPESAAVPEGPSSPVDLSQLLETPSSGAEAAPDSDKTKPASGKSSDLDEEMRRLLGEIAGDPKAN